MTKGYEIFRKLRCGMCANVLMIDGGLRVGWLIALPEDSTQPLALAVDVAMAQLPSDHRRSAVTSLFQKPM